MDRSTWSAAEAADKLLTAVQNLLPTTHEDEPQAHRSTMRTVTLCVSEMLADAGLCSSAEYQADCLPTGHGPIADILRSLLAALDDESERSDEAAAAILTELHTRLTVLQDG